MRKILLTTVAVLASAICLASCGNKQKQETMKQTENGKKVLVAFYSRTGENYAVGNIKKGNTHIVAEMIAERMGADLFEIKPVNDYPEDYTECTEVAKAERETNARPAIKADQAINDYDIIFIGYPIWWGDAPMPVYTWIDKHDWNGKTVVPFCTHEGSGLGSSPSYIGNACKGATIAKGFELTGTTAQKRQDEAKKEVNKWLNEIGL